MEGAVGWWNGRERACLLALNGARAHFTRDLLTRARRHVGKLSDAEKHAIVEKYEDGSKQSNLGHLKDFREAQDYKRQTSGRKDALLDPSEKLDILVNGLRSEDVFQISQFYYELEETSHTNPAKMRSFLIRHNEYMNELASNPKRCIAMGVRSERIAKAILSESQIKSSCLFRANEENGRIQLRVAFDQTVLGSLFADTMSREQTRLSVVLLQDFGFLNRHQQRGSVEVISNGEMEDCFRSYMRNLLAELDEIRGQHGGSVDANVSENA